MDTFRRKTNIKSFCIIVIVIALSVAGLGGFFLGRNARKTVSPVEPASLPLQVTVDYDLNFTTFPLEQQNYSKLTYLGIRSVTVDVDGKTMKLEDAVQDGAITLDQLIASARLDAVKGVCHETAESKNGLTRFTYRYPDYYLLYAYDLYETPDGKRHLIKDFTITASAKDPIWHTYEDENGEPIDYEDWGLSFEAANVSPTGLTLQCTQSGGQQVGALVIENYYLDRQNADTWEHIEPVFEDFSMEARPDIMIQMEETSEATIDLSRTFGMLAAGDYALTLEIHDRYREEDLSALMRKYHNTQFYVVSFSVA